MMRQLLIISLLLVGCEPSPKANNFRLQVVTDRLQRPMYHAEVPKEWQRSDLKNDLHDTTVPITFFEADGVHITVHTFPKMRIPPEAQISRWLKQIVDLQVEDVKVEPVGHGGYLGLRVEAPGLIAFAMQMAPEHFQRNSEETHRSADYTIKAVGSDDAIAKQRQNILHFAQTFELIEELPSL